MKPINIEATKSSPEIKFNPDNRELKIKGESYPEDSFSFYKKIFELLEDAKDEFDEFTIEIEVTYLNTSSTKSFMNILDILEEGYKNGKDFKVKWYYEEDNEHAYELALDFRSYLELPFNIIPKE